MKKYVFLDGNEIPYGQDFAQWRGVDSNVVFTQCLDNPIFKKKEDVWLRAPGYGGEPYGNGRIVIRKKDLKENKKFVRIVK